MIEVLPSMVPGDVDVFRRIRCDRDGWVELNDVKAWKRELDCLNMCQHLGEGQFLITTDAPRFSLARVVGRKSGERNWLISLNAFNSS